MTGGAVTIDAVDAIEAAELVAFVEAWLAQAGPEIRHSFEAFAGPWTLLELRAELVAVPASLGMARIETP